jgi:hypothetical protein
MFSLKIFSCIMYSYRIAADLEMNLRKPLPLLPNLSEENKPVIRLSPLADCKIELLRSSSDPNPIESLEQTVPSALLMKKEPPLVARFAASLRDIELQRVKIRDDIKVITHVIRFIRLIFSF